ncbi:hypothetical protein [Acinetobacter soli]|uniref:hypothetical protein n=1 Tax=Acinetobacter soli TaxID=487316 RepID=UPI00124FA4F9|nr:hypothetical protein [Acinetobacter soli]
MKKQNLQLDHFDKVVDSRLFAHDFAQPKHDYDFYKSKALEQINAALQNICKAHSNTELTIAVSTANAFIDSAYHLELIDLGEKAFWVEKLNLVYKEAILEA